MLQFPYTNASYFNIPRREPAELKRLVFGMWFIRRSADFNFNNLEVIKMTLCNAEILICVYFENLKVITSIHFFGCTLGIAFLSDIKKTNQFFEVEMSN